MAGFTCQERVSVCGVVTGTSGFDAERSCASDLVCCVAQEERKRLKTARRAGLAGGAILEDFGDEVADIVGASDR